MPDTTTARDRTRTFSTPRGSVVARVDGDVVRVLGIPYATAERFAPPEPVLMVGDDGRAFEALTRAPAAPQVSSPVLDSLLEGASSGMTMSEDCLRLSVTAPADIADDERLPVMVWIHGGAYVTGAGDLELYDPRDLVTEQRVVVVTVTYRLGLFGFFGDGAAIPANLGLLDLLEAIRWIRASIESFGGDADRVTLFGQSAGADAIAHLMISQGSSGLFHRAILQSAPLGLSRARSAMSSAMAAAAGHLSPTAPIDEILERQPLAERAALRFGLRAGMPFGTRYGEAPLPAESDRDGAWRAAAPGVEVLIGSTADETGLYLPFVPGVKRIAKVPVLGEVARRILVSPSTAAVYGRDVDAFAARHRAAGGLATTYRFDWAPNAATAGSVHMSELPLLLGPAATWARTSFVGAANLPEIERRGPLLRAAWAAFARTGRIPVALDAALAGTVSFSRA